MKRHLAIGDIHGCKTSLTSLVAFVGLHPDDTIVTLGDYVDRGPDSRGVIDFLISLSKTHSLVPLRGNHEIMMLDSREKQSWMHAWLGFGGDATLQSYAGSNDETGSFDDIPESHLDFLENRLVSFYECETHFFVHANADPAVALQDQADAALYWRKFKDQERHLSGKVMVCGHTPQLSGIPRNTGNAVCIDTWAFGEGWLSCLDVASGTVWQANEAADTRTFTLQEAETS